jgi:hypothetical protein
MSAIETPMISRCLGLRVPLATTRQLMTILCHDGLDVGGLHPYLIKYNCCEFFFAIYITWLSANTPELVTEDLCKYNIVAVAQLFKNKKSLTIEDIRTFVSQISVHEDSLYAITQDILHNIHTTARKHEFIEIAARIDHMCATTQGHRKPMYMELLLNIAVFGKRST